MSIIVVILSALLTVVATATLCYISIATVLGPWIAPTLVLCSAACIRLFCYNLSSEKTTEYLAVIQSIAAGGGALGIGIGFTFPMLYFLDPVVFAGLIQDPWIFSFKLGFSCFAAGGFGIVLGSLFSHNMIETKALPFPASNITFNVIKSSSNMRHARNLFLGVLVACAIYFLQHGALGYAGILPFVIPLIPYACPSGLFLMLSPLYWALGFTAGLKIAFPLLVGALSKNIFTYFLYDTNPWVATWCSNMVSEDNILMGFCTGLILSEIIIGLLPSFLIFLQKIVALPGLWRTGVWHIFDRGEACHLYGRLRDFFSRLADCWIELAIVLLMCSVLLFHLDFSLPMQVVLLSSTAVATYYGCLIGAEIGMVQFGRFSTFVIIIMMALFSLTPLQITAAGVFLNLCMATASDLLFDQKILMMSNVSVKRVRQQQWYGLIISSLCIGFILWLIFTNYQLGSPELFAQRSKTKALLVQALHFEWVILLAGFGYGLLLKRFRVSPTMALGGLLMPNKLISGLVAGALLTKCVGRKEDYLPFAAGIFTTETLTMIIAIIVKKFFV